MGYTTKFDGQFHLDKTLTLAQYNTLLDFSRQNHRHHTGAPSSYCDWEPTKDGNGIKHNGSEGSSAHEDWLVHLIEHFLKPWEITMNGEVTWQGAEAGDVGTIVIKDNVVTSQKLQRNAEVLYCDNCGFSYDSRDPHRH